MTFSEEFQRTRGKPIDVGGHLVIGMLRHQVLAGDRVRILWRKWIDTPVQGICIKLDKGTLTINGGTVADGILWRDTAPDETVVVCNRAGELRMWNCWRIHRDVIQAWVGNAGMKIHRLADDRLIAECNSRPEVTFEDLVFEIIVERAAP